MKGLLTIIREVYQDQSNGCLAIVWYGVTLIDMTASLTNIALLLAEGYSAARLFSAIFLRLVSIHFSALAVFKHLDNIERGRDWWR